MNRSLAIFVVTSILAFFFSVSTVRASLLFDKPNYTYTIKTIVDLEGKTIQMPENCTVRVLKGGLLKNGTLVGNGTVLQVNKRVIHFREVRIEGSWKINKIYSEWFALIEDANNTIKLRSLFALCDNETENDVYIQSGRYCLDSYNEQLDSPAVIRIPSRTKVHNKATFKALPGSHDQSFLFYFSNVSNCLWEGGSIIGDVETHLGEKGEQGFALALRGAENIKIQNVSCLMCWGDGINLQYAGAGRHNRNILISNVVCDGNRRQGISIEDGVNVTVVKSVFRNTGIVRGTNPKYGIDIEPCYEGASIKDVMISGCEFCDNAGGGLNCSFLKKSDSSIRVANCHDDGGGLRFNSCEIDLALPGIFVENYQCENGKLKFKRNVQNIRIINSSFMSALNETGKTDRLSNLIFDNLRLRSGEQRTWNYYCLSFVCDSMEDVSFNNCHFEVLAGSDLSAVLPTGGDWSGARMNNCFIIDYRDNVVYIPCDIIGSRIESSKPIAFTNHKKSGALQFSGNSVVVRTPIDDSPFRFQPSSNREYDISDNDIYYFGETDNDQLVLKANSNTVNPQVTINNNRLHKKH